MPHCWRRRSAAFSMPHTAMPCGGSERRRPPRFSPNRIPAVGQSLRRRGGSKRCGRSGCRSNSLDARMNGSAMGENHTKPRVGIPWRTVQEEKQANWPKLGDYLDAVKAAGGQPVPVSLELSPADLNALAQTLDAFVLPGSPADVDPPRYGAARHPQSPDADPSRERTDWALLDNAFADKKPVLAICYGVQLLNVYLGGSLLQDIRSQGNTNLRHPKKDPPR